MMSILTLFGKMKPQYYPIALKLARPVHCSRPPGEEGWLFLQTNYNTRWWRMYRIRLRTGNTNSSLSGVIRGVQPQLVIRMLALAFPPTSGKFAVSLNLFIFVLCPDINFSYFFRS